MPYDTEITHSLELLEQMGFSTNWFGRNGGNFIEHTLLLQRRGKTFPSVLQKKNVRKLEQNMKVQFSVNLIIWFKVLRKLVKLSLTVKTGQTMSCWAVSTGIIAQEFSSLLVVKLILCNQKG